MKKQKNNFPTYHGLQILFLALLGVMSTWTAEAQKITDEYQFDNSQRIRDITVPDGYSYVYLETQGGDGAKAWNPWGSSKLDGGKGAKVSGYVRIGTGEDQIPPGSTLRFIIGQKGGQGYHEGSGGGGSGIVFREPTGTWRILMVAGGGGGACSHDHGHSGRGDAAGGSCGSDAAGGRNGGNGAVGDYHIGQGGYGYLAAINQEGEPVGIEGSRKTTQTRGGFGFGGGGGSDENTGGGGGGYSGGASAEESGGGGGGTYADPDWVLSPLIEFFPETASPQNGYARYRFSKTSPALSVHLAKDVNKCLDLNRGNTANGTNIQLFSCKNNSAQQWTIDEYSLHLAKGRDKCLDLDHSSTANATNIQLWDCNGTHAQKWIYDLSTQSIRSGIDFDKCLDLDHTNTADGANIQLWNCNGSAAQKWIIDGLPEAMPSDANQRIHLAMNPKKCVDIQDARTTNGTNIQLYQCRPTNSQYFLFDGRRIRMQSAPDKCVDIDPGTEPDAYTKVSYLGGLIKETGTLYSHFNVRLWDCDKAVAQEWIYDAIGKAFRLGINTNLCLDLDNSNATDGANIQVYLCNGTDAQRFEIY